MFPSTYGGSSCRFTGSWDNVADAQDLTQEAFIKALQHQEQLKDEQKAAHWLSRIATNTAIDFLRRSGRATFCEIDEAPESHTESPEQELLRGEHREYLEDGLRLLSPRERQALMLRDVEGLPAEEVAQHTGLLQGHGAVAYRQRAHQVAAVHGKKEAVAP